MNIKLKNLLYCDNCPILNSSEYGVECNLNHFKGYLENRPQEKTGYYWLELKFKNEKRGKRKNIKK